MRKPKTALDWHLFALACAADAGENHFEDRRGLWHFTDLDVLVVFSNNPYAKSPTMRDEETAEFRRRLRAEGLKVLAYMTYPGPGSESAGYTYAMVIRAGEDHIDQVLDIRDQVTMESLDKLGALHNSNAAGGAA
jgi:hypothetical protein